MSKTPRIFVDMDGVIVDADRYAREFQVSGEELKKRRGAYLLMHPIPGALDGVRSLIGMGYEVWLATKPPTGIPWAYADKVSWVLINLPELKERIILTHDKGLLGDGDDLMIDDHPPRANCREFKGALIRFGGDTGWPEVLEFLRKVQDAQKKLGDETGRVE